MRILLVEDDDAIANVLERGFINEYYAVDVAKDGHLGWQLVKAYDYDLIVLDVMLPKLDGIEFCQRLRDSAYQMPVLMVTALDSSTRKIAGLNAGADDYITKPFELEELLTRARVLRRRAQTPMLQVLEWGDLQLDPNTREVAYGSQALSLTPKKYRLLELFLRKPSQVFSRGAILDSLWNCGEAPGEDTVTAHIKGLRRKLTDAGAPSDLIKTVYGVGYRLKPRGILQWEIFPQYRRASAERASQKAASVPKSV
jgi:DNA-binding response OmpR family regulator